MINILLVEDDPILSDSIKDILIEIGEVTQIYDGDEGLFEAQSGLFDMIVLDIMLPHLNGYDILGTLRDNDKITPVLLLTAKDGIDDKVKGFQKGADDYLTKPFHREELLLRCQAMLKRSIGMQSANQLVFGNTVCDITNRLVTISEHQTELPGKEFDILVYLIQQKNRIITKEQIFDRIWGFDSETSYTVVEVYMSNLRKNLKAHQSDVDIKTLRNVGYLLGEDESMKQSFKELRSLFIRNALAFGLIFFLLGLLVNQVLNVSLYRNVDEELKHLANDDNFIQREVDRLNVNNNDDKQTESLEERPLKMKPNNFMTQTILWSKEGEILNKEALGDRIYDFSDLELADNKDKITAIQVTDSFGNVLNFRSIIKMVSTDSEVACIQILSNTNQTESSLIFFRSVLIVSMIIFWIISLFVSYYLAKRNLQPVLVSWKKQQEFVENSSHELRTPLTIIQAKLEKLFTHPNHTIVEESEDIALALNEVRRLNQLTTDLLLLARSDSNELSLDSQQVDTHQFLEKLIQPYQEIAQSHSKSLVFHEKSATTLTIDPKLITQVMIILIDNALKYTPEDGTITVFSEVTDKHWHVTVADNGIGLTTKNKELLFERFYREDKARQRGTGGHGLGLSIAKGIIDLHQGKIKAADNQPKGTVFHITLPK